MGTRSAQQSLGFSLRSQLFAAVLLQHCWQVTASSSTSCSRATLSTRFPFRLPRQVYFEVQNENLKMRQKTVLKKCLQRVPKWTPKVDQNREKACSGGAAKMDIKKVPSPGPRKVRFCCYLLHFSKVRGLKQYTFLGTILGIIWETKSWKQGSR